ncbi:zinc finger protein Pegasus [Strongylocentrotus purpuratus]|uniref:C2H2-type domain-containing protein n=1 Tax=Strongylocentrotus purpuratus TaxID=7668 RepID=A0A7M7HKU7_STRPU|nr:zinc finger protein Pegasus [Strongylocentrotus purpuratus]|eukprot:XP_011677424.1 PREDICTED: zinc finger protein Pegasus-like [Strongylocentrotus purpuratus]
MASSTVDEEETYSPLSNLEEETRSPLSTMEEETRSPIERICQVLSSKTKNSDDADDQGESLSNPVTSALQFRFKCDKCEQSFSSKGGCTNHKKRVHPTDDDLTRHWHTCEQCGKSFFYKKQYDNHVTSCTGSVDGDKAGSICICPMCPFTCFDKVDLAHHVVSHEQTETEDGDLLEPPVLEEAVYGRDSNGQYDADIPAASPTLYVDESLTDSVMNEIEPEIMQSEKGTWQCPMCPIRCTEKDVVKAHMRDRHLNKVRKHICNICKRAFTHSSGLKQHVTRVHSVPGPPPDPDGAKFFKCGLCGKSFSLVRSLISHWPTHKLQTCSSLENFQCILCKAFFQLPSQLQDHFIKQHPQEATSGSLPSARVSEKRPHQDDPSDSQPTIKQEKLDFSAIDDDRDSARGMPGFLSSRQCQDNSFDSDYHPTPSNTRKMKATTSAASPAVRSSRLGQSPHAPKESDGDDRPGSHISSMSGSDSSKEPVVDGNYEDTEPTSSQSCASCMEKSGRLLTSCKHCGIFFTDFVMHTLHMGLHGQDYPFQCHHCGKNCQDKYNFFTHIYRESHM